MTLRDEMRLVAVYDSEDQAREAVRALERSGVDVAQVRIADDRDHISAVEGEMRSESVNTVAGPGNVGPFTKEMTRGSLLGILVGAVVGFLAALPFAIVGVFDMSKTPTIANGNAARNPTTAPTRMPRSEPRVISLVKGPTLPGPATVLTDSERISPSTAEMWSRSSAMRTCATSTPDRSSARTASRAWSSLSYTATSRISSRSVIGRAFPILSNGKRDE